ncbi:serine hydrolase domain-containing protein [Bacteroides ihuae]|uniref:serine hydrolase domain-containing protein n=1 Tax=Bacteroides ihuae TaxID=1852362 RepID=UPI0008D9281F|nr:serine hydrolase domain-containing protein [Bacteroides ihuae]
MKRLSLYLFILSLFFCYPCSAQKYDFHPLDSIVSSWMSKGYYPGGAIAVVKNDSLLFSKNYGGFAEDKQIYVASAGKWVAAAVIAAVVDQTSLSWDDPVEKWIPEFRGNVKGAIPLRRLLSHTSGICPYLPDPKIDNYNHLDSSVMQILPLDTIFTPGSRFEYGGLAMQVAGRMAEMVTGTEFEELFQELICKPLGMTNSHFTPVNRDGGHAPMLGGGLCTTLHDYLCFLKMIYHNGNFEGKQILHPQTVCEMQADQVGTARVFPGEYVERSLGLHHTGIYGLGEWREIVDEKSGEAYQVSSPGWAGAYPWINKPDGVYGFFIAHVQGDANKADVFSSFYGSSLISRTVTEILNNHQ